MEFSLFDIVVIVFILLVGFKGIINGFIKELFALIGIVGGIFLASRFSQNAGEFINTNIYSFQNEAATQIVGFVAIFFVVWLLALLIGTTISAVANMSNVSSMLNKLLGFIFSSIKIFLFLSILVFALSSIEFIRAKMFNALGDSFMYQLLRGVGEKIVDIKIETPENLSDINMTEDVVEPIVNTTKEIVDTINNVTESSNINETPNNMESESAEKQQ